MVLVRASRAMVDELADFDERPLGVVERVLVVNWDDREGPGEEGQDTTLPRKYRTPSYVRLTLYQLGPFGRRRNSLQSNYTHQ